MLSLDHAKGILSVLLPFLLVLFAFLLKYCLVSYIPHSSYYLNNLHYYIIYSKYILEPADGSVSKGACC